MVEGCQAGGLGHLLQYMREYNAESPKQGMKEFNSIAKTIYFSYLPIIYLCFTPSTAADTWPCRASHPRLERRRLATDVLSPWGTPSHSHLTLISSYTAWASSSQLRSLSPPPVHLHPHCTSIRFESASLLTKIFFVSCIFTQEYAVSTV